MQQMISRGFLTCLPTKVLLTFMASLASFSPLCWPGWKESQFPKLGLKKEQVNVVRRRKKEIVGVGQAKLLFINNGLLCGP